MPKLSPSHPLSGYVALVTHLQSKRSEAEIQTLLARELEGKRREALIRALVARLFVTRKQMFLKSIGFAPPKHGR